LTRQYGKNNLKSTAIFAKIWPLLEVDSVGINFLLHYFAGSIEAKVVVLRFFGVRKLQPVFE